jgi:hypothetical protein
VGGCVIEEANQNGGQIMLIILVGEKKINKKCHELNWLHF